MQIDNRIRNRLGDIVAAQVGVPACDLKLDRIEGKRYGGAEAADVALLTARYRDRHNRPAMRRVVAKRLRGRPSREAGVYERLVATHAPRFSPELLAVDRPGHDEAVIFLEAVRSVSAWPWRDAEAITDVLARLGSFHTAVRASNVDLPEWDYEAELANMAGITFDLLDHCRHHPELVDLSRHRAVFRRMMEALPVLRRQLLAEQPFGYRPIHGDLHPGNAMMRRRDGGRQPILIDWGRARRGSPLEDVSSWLQCLRFWDAGAQRIHDTLFARYLSAFGMPRRLTSDIRAAYWIAGASNAMAGAIVHHLSIAMDELQRKSQRVTSANVARDWLRILRRAHAWTM